MDGRAERRLPNARFHHLRQGTPPPVLGREAELKAFAEAKRIMLIRTVGWISAIALLAVIMLFFFFR